MSSRCDGGGSEKAREAADGERLTHPPDKQHLISAAGRQQNSGRCYLTKYLPHLQLKPRDFPLYREERAFLHAATQPAHSALSKCKPHPPSCPPDRARVLIYFKGSAAKLQNFFLCFSLRLILIRLWKDSWFAFSSIKGKCNFQNHFSWGRCMKDLPAASKAEIGYFPLFVFKKKNAFFLFQVLAFISAGKTQHSSRNDIKINKVLNGWKLKWWSWPLKEKIDIELCFQQTIILVIKPQSPEHRLDARNKIWLSQRFIFMQILRNMSRLSTVQR